MELVENYVSFGIEKLKNGEMLQELPAFAVPFDNRDICFLRLRFSSWKEIEKKYPAMLTYCVIVLKYGTLMNTQCDHEQTLPV